jgi:hypothetical protein
MLATLEARMIMHDQWAIMTDDVRKAFQTVPIAALMECHERALNSIKIPKRKKAKLRATDEKNRLLRLIEIVLRGADSNRTIGIDEGGPYSPICLNALFHYFLDAPIMSKLDLPFWFRYADNLCCLGRNVSECRDVQGLTAKLLKPLGMSLHEGHAANLADGMEVQLLGFTIRRRGQEVEYGLAKGAVDQLRHNLERALVAQNPPVAACQSIRGWIAYAGPAFESGDALIATIIPLAIEHGFRELNSLDELRWQWENVVVRWRDVRLRARREAISTEAPPQSPPGPN